MGNRIHVIFFFRTKQLTENGLFDASESRARDFLFFLFYLFIILDYRIQLAQDWGALLTSIRNIPQFKKFLRPRKCEDLFRGLPAGGQVIVINVDPKRCDALALMAGCSKPIHIPLGRFSYKKASSLANELRRCLSFNGLRWRYPDESPSESDPRAVVPYNRRTADLGEVLKTLWTDLVEPILQALAIQVCRNFTEDSMCLA